MQTVNTVPSVLDRGPLFGHPGTWKVGATWAILILLICFWLPMWLTFPVTVGAVVWYIWTEDWRTYGETEDYDEDEFYYE